MRQLLKSWQELQGKVIESVGPGPENPWDPDKIALHFTDGTSVVLEARQDDTWSYPYIRILDVLADYEQRDLNFITEEEYKEKVEAQQKRVERNRRRQTRRQEREEYKRLKKIFKE